MLREGKSLRGLKLRARDDELGRVDHFLFDDEQWTIRYMVVNTGNWFIKDLVLISPRSISGVDWETHRIDVNLTRRQVETAPDISVDQPVSRQMEISHAAYYNYDPYWYGNQLWGGSGLPVSLNQFAGYAPTPPSGTEQQRELKTAVQEQSDVHLRSTREVIDYDIQARDGEIGHLSDFVMDDESWAIRYFIVSTRDWLPGKHVVFAPKWMGDINWEARNVVVDLSREQIKDGPEYDPAALNRDYEWRLHRHVGQPPYWED
jgi:uncharacterized protein YrrD